MLPRLVSSPSVAALTLLALTPLAPAQSLARIVPEAAEPTDLVILQGTGLGGTTSVDFTAIVGGFAGVWTIGVAPLSVSATEVRALVPLFNSFVPPFAGSTPFGTVRVSPPAGQLDFFYMEGTFGSLTTPGTGTTQSSGLGKPVVSFDLAGGPPEAGNPNFVALLENATPGSIAVLAISLPATPPYLPIGDGELVLDLSTLAILGTKVVSATGDAKHALPIPPGLSGVSATLQWGLLEAGSGQLGVSNGMQVVLP